MTSTPMPFTLRPRNPRRAPEPGLPAVTGQGARIVTLERASRGSDLWSAIEAAQSGRVVLHDDPADAAEAEAILRLAAALDRAVEAWEEEGLQNKAPLLRPIDESLADLAPTGLSLYWGCVERTVVLDGDTDVPMPVAVLALSRSKAPTQRIEMPLLLDAEAEEPGECG